MKARISFPSSHSFRAIILAGLLAFCLGTRVWANVHEKNILILHSYHQGLEWTDSITGGIFQTFKMHPEYNLHFQYMDSKKRNTAAYFEDLVKLYQTHQAKIKYDIIIASDNAAYNFLVSHRDTLFPDVPVFFCGVNYLNKEELVGLDQFYGFEEIADHKATIDLLIDLFPQRKRLLIINDKTITGNNIRAELEEVLPDYAQHLSIEFYTSFSIDELKKKVRSLSDDYVIYLLVINKDKNGRFISYKDGMRILKENSAVPVFGSWDFYLGKGIIGGSITSGGDQGRNVSRLAKSYLENPSVTPEQYHVGKSTNYLDYNQLRIYHIDYSQYVDTYRIINAPESFRMDVGTLLRIVMVLIGILVVVMAWLFIKRIQTRRLKSLVDRRTKELRVTNDHLERINQRKNEILGIVAHDLRNPIGNIYGLSNIILEEDEKESGLSEKSRNFLTLVQDLSDNTLKLVNDLLDISVIESGYVNLNCTHQDYVDFIRKEIEMNKALAERKELELHFESTEDTIMLCFDRIKMQQVFGNLLGNAIKFSNPKGRIEIQLTLIKGTIITKIHDYGAGIPKEKLQSIFNKFVQLDSEKKAKGSGLGLFIAKGIIEAHKGKIYVESQEGKGTTFFYDLPIDREEQES